MEIGMVQFSAVQSFSCVRLFVTPWTGACQASLSITSSQNLLKIMSFESAMPSNHSILGHPLLLLPSIFPSIRVFSNESVLLIRWPEYWSFSISPSSEYSRLISFRTDWFDILAVQQTLKSLLQHHSSIKSSSLSYLYGPILITIYDYWKNSDGNFMYTHLSNVMFFLSVYFIAKGCFSSTTALNKRIIWEVGSRKDDSTCILHYKISTDKCYTIQYLRLNFIATVWTPFKMSISCINVQHINMKSFASYNEK